MAPKHPAKERPPSKHSSASSSSDDDGGEDAFFSPPPNPKPIASKPYKQPPAPSRTSSSVSGTDDDKDHASSTDDDNHTAFSFKPPNPTAGSPPPATSRKLHPKSVKPISSKPMDAGTISSGKQKKPSASVTPAKRRPAEDSNAGSDDEEPTAKKQLFQRLWTDDDEAVVLKGMLEYKKKGKDPVADMAGFLKLVQMSLSFDCQQQQLVTKLRRLKKKLETSMKRVDKGKEPTSGKPHDKIVFELGRKIWGGSSSKPEEAANHVDNGEETVRKDDKKPKMSTLSDGKVSNRVKNNGKVSQRVDNLDVAAAGNVEGGRWEHPSWVMKDLCLRGTVICEEMVKKGVSLMDAEEVEEYDKKWKELKMMEMEIAVKRSELVRGHIQAIMEALKG